MTRTLFHAPRFSETELFDLSPLCECGAQMALDDAEHIEKDDQRCDSRTLYVLPYLCHNCGATERVIAEDVSDDDNEIVLVADA